MKALLVLTLVAAAFVPALAGTAVLADNSASRDFAPLALIKAQAASNAMLARPL